ncbi:MAG: 50S ribosomal protein L21e [Nanoarchaeota archaeon]|nr:50S ribosomal protein L21e [Nanoarchaeota archaeon]
MAKSKKIREKGKLKLGRIFQELNNGDRVAVIRDLSEEGNFPERIQGETGIIDGKQGKAYIVKISVSNKERLFIIKPNHLKKL